LQDAVPPPAGKDFLDGVCPTAYESSGGLAADDLLGHWAQRSSETRNGATKEGDMKEPYRFYRVCGFSAIRTLLAVLR
jgi:hypothetical protein